MKQYTITMTSKGQFTLPIELRRQFGLTKAGDTLKVKPSANLDELILRRPPSFEEIQAKARRFMKPGIPPLLDPRAFYDTREPKT